MFDCSLDGFNDLSPAFGAVEDDGAAELEGELKLREKDFAHLGRNVF